MRYVVDTNVWVAMFDENRSDHAAALSGFQRLRRSKHTFVVFPQILAEFWNVLTRPESARGGFGLTTQQTELRLRFIERAATPIPEPDQTYVAWRALLLKYEIMGIAFHDARIAAAMQCLGLTHIVTSNVNDFRRYGHIRAIDPTEI